MSVFVCIKLDLRYKMSTIWDMKWSYLVCEYAPVCANVLETVLWYSTANNSACSLSLSHSIQVVRLNAILGPIRYGLDLQVSVWLCNSVCLSQYLSLSSTIMHLFIYILLFVHYKLNESARHGNIKIGFSIGYVHHCIIFCPNAFQQLHFKMEKNEMILFWKTARSCLNEWMEEERFALLFKNHILMVIKIIIIVGFVWRFDCLYYRCCGSPEHFKLKY